VKTSGELLKRFRADRGMTGTDLAVALDVSGSSVRKVETNHPVGGGNVIEGLERVYPKDDAAREIVARWHLERARLSPGTDMLIPAELVQGLAEARLTRFFPSREYYGRFRSGRGNIAEYVSTAEHSLEMVSINLATGHDMEGIADTFEKMLWDHPQLTIKVSLLDPHPAASHLLKSIAPVINVSENALRERIVDTATTLDDLRKKRLAPARRANLQVWHHNCLPNASAIIIDGDYPEGVIQLETKGYKTGMGKSWGFEVAYGSDFFDTLRDSYRALIADGRQRF
jgi:transcriptional regulator with XRE-family HTH domain